MPAALVPRLAEVDDIPTRTSGKVDRDALPWPLPTADAPLAGLDGTAAWVAGLWLEVIGAVVTSRDDDFFDLGGGSLTAAQMVSLLRQRNPDVAVGDIYDHPTVGAIADHLDTLDAGTDHATDRSVRPTPLKTQAGQVVAVALLRMLAAPRWVVWLLAGSTVVAPGLRRRVAADRVLVVARRRSPGLRHAARPDAAGRRRCALPAQAPRARRAPSRRQDPPAALGRGAPGRPARGHQPRGGAVHDLVRPAPRRRRSDATPTSTPCRRSPATWCSARAARSSPRST